MNDLKNKIEELFNRKSELFESSENKRRLALWGSEIIPDEYSPGELAPISLNERVNKKIPLTADWDRIIKSKLLGFNIEEYYKDPLTYLRWTLEMDIHRFENFNDDTPLLKTVPIFMSISFEPSLFGVPIVYSTEHEPLFTSDGAVIKDKKDLVKLKGIDFFNSGLMPLAHRFYNEISKLTPKDYLVIFPKCCRGPFGVACAIRGMQNLLIDMIEDPDFVHKLMNFITNERIGYTKQRRKFLNKVEVESTLLNDEASSSIISPKFYEEFCLPYEDKLSKFYGSIRQWHSCGPKALFIPSIKKISKPVWVIDFNWWNDDLYNGIKMLSGKIPFHVRPSSQDITENNEVITMNYINSIVSICGENNYMFRIDAFQPSNPTQEDINKLNRFINVINKISMERIESKNS